MPTFGGPEVLEALDVPRPQLPPGHLRIRVHAATVNPADRNIRTGFYVDPPDQFPYVPGMEAAGVVEEIAPGAVTSLRVGERVMAIVMPYGTHGAYAEEVVVPVESVVPVPLGFSFAEAATIPMNGLTARLALDSLALAEGQTVAVTGAAGAVGGYAVQLAKADGLRVIADAKSADADLVRALGADLVVPRGEDFSKHVRELVASGVDGLVDGAVLESAAVPAVKDGGQVASLRGYADASSRGIVFHAVMAGQHIRDRLTLERLRLQAESGQLKARICETFPADRAVDAHRRLDQGGNRGRIVLTFDEVSR